MRASWMRINLPLESETFGPIEEMDSAFELVGSSSVQIARSVVMHWLEFYKNPNYRYPSELGLIDSLYVEVLDELMYSQPHLSHREPPNALTEFIRGVCSLVSCWVEYFQLTNFQTENMTVVETASDALILEIPTGVF